MLWKGMEDEHDCHSIEMADDGRRTWIESLLVLSCVGIQEGQFNMHLYKRKLANPRRFDFASFSSNL